jgi:hypothetical protein
MQLKIVISKQDLINTDLSGINTDIYMFGGNSSSIEDANHTTAKMS